MIVSNYARCRSSTWASCLQKQPKIGKQKCRLALVVSLLQVLATTSAVCVFLCHPIHTFYISVRPSVHSFVIKLWTCCSVIRQQMNRLWCKLALSNGCWGRDMRQLVAWYSGRTSVFDRRTFPVLHSTSSWRVTTYVCKPPAIVQPTRPTPPFILSGSMDE